MNKQLLENMIRNGGMTTAQKLLSTNANVNSLRTNATLRKEEWLEYDTGIVEEAQDRLVGVADLLSRGLRYTVGNGLGKMILESENVSDMRAAEVNMDGVTRGQNDAVNYEIVGLPLPLIHKDYQISIRKLMASRNTGESLDVTQARLASREVANTQEGILFNGFGSFAFGGYNLYGYTNFPDRNTGSLTADWKLGGTAGTTIVSDVLSMKQDNIDAKMFGPYILYIPTEYETKMDEDYSTAKGSNTIRERIEKISGLGVGSVKVSDSLSDGEVLLVQMTQDVVRMVEGLPLTNVEWEQQGGMVMLFKVMTISVPQLRTDQSGNSGITNYSV